MSATQETKEELEKWLMSDIPDPEPLSKEERSRRRRDYKKQREELTMREFEMKSSLFYGWRLCKKRMTDMCSICNRKHSAQCSVELPCSHVFGYKCIAKWVKEYYKTRCPFCNENIVLKY